jgi:hypothetical protein
MALPAQQATLYWADSRLAGMRVPQMLQPALMPRASDPGQGSGRGSGGAGTSAAVAAPSGRSGRERERRAAQRKRRTQRGLEENVRRTVYISYVDQQASSAVLSACG